MRLTPSTKPRPAENREVRYKVGERGDIDCIMDGAPIYWIDAETVMDEDWEDHMAEKLWVVPEQFNRAIAEARLNYQAWKRSKV